MNILITGGTGLIGSALSRFLLAKKEEGANSKASPMHKVWVLSRDVEKVTKVCGKKAVGVSTLAQLDADKIGIDVVINLMGEPIADKAWTDKRKAELKSSRVDFTRNLVAWMGKRTKPPKTLISASAVGYYGDRGDDVVDDASNEFSHEFLCQLCHAWEVEAFQALLHNTRIACLRTGIVLSPKGGLLKRVMPIFKMGLGGAIGTGKQWMPWIHIDDAVRMIDFIMQSWEMAGSFNVCSPEPVTNKQFAKALGKALHRPALIPMPTVVLEKRYGTELTEVLLWSQRVVPKRAMDAGFTFQYPKIGDALRNMLKD